MCAGFAKARLACLQLNPEELRAKLAGLQPFMDVVLAQQAANAEDANGAHATLCLTQIIILKIEHTRPKQAYVLCSHMQADHVVMCRRTSLLGLPIINTQRQRQNQYAMSPMHMPLFIPIPIRLVLQAGAHGDGLQSVAGPEICWTSMPRWGKTVWDVVGGRQGW